MGKGGDTTKMESKITWGSILILIVLTLSIANVYASEVTGDIGGGIGIGITVVDSTNEEPAGTIGNLTNTTMGGATNTNDEPLNINRPISLEKQRSVPKENVLDEKEPSQSIYISKVIELNPPHSEPPSRKSFISPIDNQSLLISIFLLLLVFLFCILVW